MKKLYMGLSLCVALGLVFDTSVQSAEDTQQSAKDTHDEIAQTAKASLVFREIMSAPDKGIPRRVLDNADCIAVFPQVIKAALGIGGRGGRGVAVCRTAKGWSAPAYLNVGGGSFGFQIGVESTDYVMLFMTPESVRSLLQSNFKLGGNISVAAGPIGREAEAATDLNLDAQILSYSRSKGLFAGVALEGAVIETADRDMRDVYGSNVTARAVFDGTVQVPQEVTAFTKTIESYTGGRATATSGTNTGGATGTSGTKPR
jgi:lipid-binding SYLF domain-containing protein